METSRGRRPLVGGLGLRRITDPKERQVDALIVAVIVGLFVGLALLAKGAERL